MSTGPAAKASSPEGGSYLLILRMLAPATIMVGRLGRVEFPASLYSYTGSALNGLQARVARHLRGGGRVHWHIDHLRRCAEPEGALLIRSPLRLECALNQLLGCWPGFAPHAPGFGCSDCSCTTHLHRLDEDALSHLKALFGPAAWLAHAPGQGSRSEGFLTC
jgi:sugar fermentation stimulation protein A